MIVFSLVRFSYKSSSYTPDRIISCKLIEVVVGSNHDDDVSMLLMMHQTWAPFVL